MNKRVAYHNKYTKRFLFLTGILFIIGLLILYSASSVQSFKLFGSPNSLILHQFFFGGVIGMVGLYAAYKLNYTIWQKLSLFMVLGSAVLLIALHISGFGFSSGGATRWLNLGPFSFQPGEIAKLSAVIYTAAWLSKYKHSHPKTIMEIAPVLVVTAILGALLLVQPDMGTAVALVGSVGGLIIISGIEWKQLAILCIICVVSGLVLIRLEPYRFSRLTTFLNPEKDPLGAGYQVNQALVGIGSGGLWGQGYGMSKQKHNYLPEPIGDSVFAVAAEEMGMVRITAILALFSAWLMAGFSIARHAKDTFGKLLASGITTMIGVQSLVNIGAIVGLLPLTGLPWPFVSYGSSALIMTLIACGIILSVSKHNKLNQ